VVPSPAKIALFVFQVILLIVDRPFERRQRIDKRRIAQLAPQEIALAIGKDPSGASGGKA
jgi:hypothetical protein